MVVSSLKKMMLLVVSLVFLVVQVEAGKQKLLILTLVPENNDVLSADQLIPAAQMGLEDINNNSSLLPDYELMMKIVDSQCDSSIGTSRLVNSVLDTRAVNETKIIIVLGGACSVATEPTTALTGKLYGIVQLSYAATSPLLSDRTLYPIFFRMSPSEIIHNNARFAFMNMYKWCYVATLHQSVNLFSLTVQNFHDRFKEMLAINVQTCNNTKRKPILFSFTGDPEIPLRQIKEKKIRIIQGFFYEDKALIVMCYAIKLELTTPYHIWILPSWYVDGWWNKADTFDWTSYAYQCNGSEIKKALKNALLVDLYAHLENPDEVSISGYTNGTFYKKYLPLLDDFIKSNRSKVPGNTTLTSYATLMYDSLWTIGIALNRTETVLKTKGYSLTDFTYKGTSVHSWSNISNILASKMQETDFLGVSGHVKFDINGTRLGKTGVSQYRENSNGILENVLLSVYDYLQDGLVINYTIEPTWNLGRPPTDVSTPQSQLLNPIGIYMMDFVIGVGIIVAVILLVFNIVTIRKALIANSAPHINTIIIIGCIVMMATCILLGIDSGTPQVTSGDRSNVLADINDSGKQRYASICMIRVWLFTIGFTLSFGALFAKTLQVYRIYTNTKLKEQPFKMWNFLIIMAIQLVLDIIILSIWTGLFRFHHEIIDVDDEDKNIIKKYEKCECDNFPYLIGALYVYKGLLVVFGLFLAYESRNVKYFYINDSRFVSIAMYIVVILIGISAPLSLILANNFFIDPAYLVAVIMIVTACMCCLLFLYIPKFVYMAKGMETMIPRTRRETITQLDTLTLGHTENEDGPSEKISKDENKKVKFLSVIRYGSSNQDSGVSTDCNSRRDSDHSYYESGDYTVFAEGQDNIVALNESSFTNGDIAISAVNESFLINGDITISALNQSSLTNGDTISSVLNETSFTNGDTTTSVLNESSFTNGDIAISAVNESFLTNGDITTSVLNESSLTNGDTTTSVLNETSLTNGDTTTSVLNETSLTNGDTTTSVLNESSLTNGDTTTSVLNESSLTNGDTTTSVLNESSLTNGDTTTSVLNESSLTNGDTTTSVLNESSLTNGDTTTSIPPQ